MHQYKNGIQVKPYDKGSASVLVLSLAGTNKHKIVDYLNNIINNKSSTNELSIAYSFMGRIKLFQPSDTSIEEAFDYWFKLAELVENFFHRL